MEKNIDSEKRMPYVDVAKGIGIFLVVFGHNAACEPGSHLTTFIYSFHMPLFYFLAGLFHDDAKSLVSHVARKAKSLLLPCVLAFAAWLLVQAITIPEILFPALGDLAINALYGTGKTLFWGQLWFLTSLFVTTCACHLLIRSGIANNTCVRLIIAFLLVPAGTMYPLYLELYSRGLPWNIDLLPITAAFYLLGTTFPKQRFGNLGSKSCLCFLASAIAFALVGAGSWLMDWRMDLNIRHYSHWAGSTLVAICGIGGVLLLSLALEKLSRQWPSKTLSFIGKRSLFILVLHFSFQQNSFGKMVAEGVPWLIAAIGSFVIGLGTSLAAALLWEWIRKKRTPRKRMAA